MDFNRKYTFFFKNGHFFKQIGTIPGLIRPNVHNENSSFYKNFIKIVILHADSSV